jgi:hypothetical protein
MARYALVGRTLAAALLVATVSSIAPADQGDRLVKRWQFKNEPVSISNFQVNGQAVTFGEPFSAGPGWLAGVSFDVTNVSDRTITMLRVIGGRKELHYDLLLGAFGSDTEKYGVSPTARLAPGETVRFDFSRELPVLLPRLPVALRARVITLTELTVHVGRIVFEDDTMWEYGSILERDPNNHDHWVVRR